jgi:hypothetical protein
MVWREPMPLHRKEQNRADLIREATTSNSLEQI